MRSLVVAFVVLGLMAGCSVSATPLFDSVTAGIQGQSLALFDETRPLGTVQNTRICVDTDRAEVLLAPDTDRALVAAGNAGIGGVGTVMVFANTAFVNGAVQLGASASPSTLGSLLVNSIEFCSLQPASSTIVVMDSDAFSKANAVTQWLRNAGLTQALALPGFLADGANADVLVTTRDNTDGTIPASYTDMLNRGGCLIVATNPTAATSGSDDMLNTFDMGISLDRSSAGAAASAAYIIPSQPPTGTFHCCEAATTCSGHGLCNVDGSCACGGGYTGGACQVDPPCLNPGCNGNGNCDVNGNCACTGGWSGTFCATPPICISSVCNGHGACSVDPDDGSCVCTGGWSGTVCNVEPTCENPGCSGHGACSTDPFDGSCACTDNWTGANCEVPPACVSTNCNNQGTCNSDNSGCDCVNGYTGNLCELPPICVTSSCNGVGICDPAGTGLCICGGGFTGDDCSGPRFCDGGCSNNGVCNSVDGSCDCIGGFTGVNCDGPRPCDAGCNGRGVCNPVDGTCLCDPTLGWVGAQCDTVPGNCALAPTFMFQGNAYVNAGSCNALVYPCTPLVVNQVTFPYQLLGTQNEMGSRVAREACL